MVYYFYYLRDMAYRYMGECRHANGARAQLKWAMF